MTVTADPAPVFHALSDSTRRMMLDWVALGEARTATELSARLPISRQAVSKHIDVLSAAGLVAGERVGREMRYSVQAAPLDAAAVWLERRSAAWDRRLAALKRHVEGEASVADIPTEE